MIAIWYNNLVLFDNFNDNSNYVELLFEASFTVGKSILCYETLAIRPPKRRRAGSLVSSKRATKRWYL